MPADPESLGLGLEVFSVEFFFFLPVQVFSKMAVFIDDALCWSINLPVDLLG